MKTRTTAHVLFAIAMTGMLASCSSSKPPETSSIALPLPADQTAPAVSDASGASQPAQSAAVSTAIPSATDDIWKALDKQSADLQTAIQSGAMKDVQAKSDAIRDLTAALPAHASKLPADAQAKLQQDVTYIATLVEHLDAAASASDKTGAQTNYKKLNDALGGLTRFP